MLRMPLKLIYLLAGLLWTGYWWWNLLSAHVASHTPISIGTVACLALFVSIPALGYVLLFIALPWAGRFLRS